MAAVPRVSAAARFFAVLRGARLEIPAKPEPELRDSGRMAGFGGLLQLFTRSAVGGKGARPGRKDEVPAPDLHRADQKRRDAAARGAVLRTLSQHLPSDRAPRGRVGVAVGEHQLRAVGTAVLALAHRARSVVRATGTASSIAMMTLPLTRWAPLLWFHPVVVFISTVPGLVAAGTCIYGLSRCGRPWRALWALGLATFVVASVDSVLYVIHLVTRTPVVFALPALQRLATLMFLSFVCAGALRIRALGSAARPAFEP